MSNNNLLWLTEKPIAHRGHHDHEQMIPENSLLAFSRAVESGYGIEMDVQVLLDEEVVVFHDYNLKRLCKNEVEVSSLSSTDLHRYRLSNTTHQIPLLSEVLKIVNGKVPLFIEIKRQPAVKNANMVILNSLDGYHGKVAIMSFDPFVLGWFARNAPLIPRGQLSSDFKDLKMPGLVKYLLRNFRLNFISKPHFIAHDEKDLANPKVKKLKRKGIPVIAWTLKELENHNRVAAHCDNIIFEGFVPKI